MDRLLTAIQENNLPLVESLLLEGVDPIADDYAPIKSAVQNGYLEIASRLLKDPRVNHVQCLEWVAPIIIRDGAMLLIHFASTPNFSTNMFFEGDTNKEVFKPIQHFVDFNQMLDVPDKDGMFARITSRTSTETAFAQTLRENISAQFEQGSGFLLKSNLVSALQNTRVLNEVHTIATHTGPAAERDLFRNLNIIRTWDLNTSQNITNTPSN